MHPYRKLAGFLAGTVLLTGCTSMLEKEYLSVTPHNSTLSDASDPSVLRVESYQELVNALVYFISAGTESGTVRLYLDPQQVESTLDNACLEVVQEDPLGAYAVDYIKYSVTPMVTYSEAEVEITYRRTKEQISSIISATGPLAIRSELEEALSNFSSDCTLRISYFDWEEKEIQTLVREAYLSSPSSALDFPSASIAIYPNSGKQRIVEISLMYHLTQEELFSRRQQILDVQQELSQPLLADSPNPQQLADLLRTHCTYRTDGGSTPYHALIDKEANSEGFALAYALLCESLSLPCHVVSGTKNDMAHCWVVVQYGEFWYHLDSTDAKHWNVLYNDTQMEENGYQWNRTSIPECVGSLNAIST